MAEIRRGMWILVDAGLMSRADMRRDITIDDFMDAWQFLQAKRAAEAKQSAANELRMR